MRTKLDVIIATMKAECCDPHWIDNKPTCRAACGSFAAYGTGATHGWPPTCSIEATDTDEGRACYPMLAAMTEALQVPHE